ncbi:MAG: acylphosphatase [Methanoregula sp.]|nr:acylphosphatase [Methanoregula sp.]PKL65567.1 MAG: acylphosphatase [Methanomicrobiales archaeon HGW-Methanomicrobiales-3]
MKTIELLISGRVQKVGFRACVKKIASDLHVTGTVINLTDGRVQIYATADEMILEKFISMIYGCPRAVIREIRSADIPVKSYDDFSVIKGEGRISTGL